MSWSPDGEWIPFPTYEESEQSAFEMVVAGRLDGDDVAVMMVEAGGTANTWELYENGTPKVDEDTLAGGLEACKTWIHEMIELQQSVLDQLVRSRRWKPRSPSTTPTRSTPRSRPPAPTASPRQKIADKTDRQNAESEVNAALVAELEGQFDGNPDAVKQIKAAARSVMKKVVRKRIVEEGIRIDGRKAADLRTVTSEVGVIPTSHGSGLFQRGETQVLNITTLGMGRSDMMIDDLSPTEKKRYFHHYNFPPFSTGETGFMRGPKRREIGHGALAERAVFPVVPNFEEWPYTVRTVSEVMASNGSSSMGSVCGSTLSLMDAGVPIKAPVAGIAMGLVHAEGEFVTLTDILGAEDAFGDMDFKVAGTTDFITALSSTPRSPASPPTSWPVRCPRPARPGSTSSTSCSRPSPSEEVRDTAPKIVSFEIPIDKIGEVIGPKGKVINTIQGETGADISVDDDGMVGVVSIASTDNGAVAEARRQIELILDPPTAEVGAEYAGRVVNITKFGAFVNILPGRDGLLHISKIGGSKRIDRVEDVLELGQEVQVVVEDVDPNSKISLKPVGDGPEATGGDAGEASDAAPAAAEVDGEQESVSFEEAFDAGLAEEFGDLGPEAPRRSGGGGGRGRGRGGRGRR